MTSRVRGFFATLVAAALASCAANGRQEAEGTAEASSPAYVDTASLRCRASPDASATTVAKLPRNQLVAVVTEQDGWAKVQRDAGDCWVSTSYLTREAPPAGERLYGDERPAQAAVSTIPLTRAHRTRPTRTRSARASRSRRHHQSQGLFGSGCPCSGPQVCIGPRGGRYCITSGGNKRYGV